ncbi:MAG: nitrogen fixation protein [Bacteroidetes bacterium]|nr:nitrogen fixation protein [Bacteroidota bacterium]
MLCPSVWPDMPGAQVFGVIDRSGEKPVLTPLQKPVPVTPEILELAAPADPALVFRFTGTCAESKCQHFDGHDCTLATRVVQLLPPVTDDLPICSIRPDCRWWAQEGRAACMRCPELVSHVYEPTITIAAVADPPTHASAIVSG